MRSLRCCTWTIAEKKKGEWVPNQFGGNQNLEAISFLKQLNEVVYARHPGVLMVAEESTGLARCKPTDLHRGLGLGFKWNMGSVRVRFFTLAAIPFTADSTIII